MTRARRLLLLPVLLGLAPALMACGSGGTAPLAEAADPTSASSAAEPSAEPSGDEAGDFATLAGRWQYQGEFPADVATLIIEADGAAEYIGEGSVHTYRGVLEVSEHDNGFDAYTLDAVAYEDGQKVSGGATLELSLVPSDDAETIHAYLSGSDGYPGKDMEFTKQ